MRASYPALEPTAAPTGSLFAFDLAHLGRLVGDSQIAVDEADAAAFSQRYRQLMLCYGVHRRRHDGCIQRDAPRQLRPQFDLCTIERPSNRASAGRQLNVEGEG